MLLITGPLLAILAVLGFLFEVFYFKQPVMPTYRASANVMLYHDMMNSYALGSLNSVATPYLIASQPPYFNNINYTAMGDYQSQILNDSTTNVNYLVTSFNQVNGSSVFALKTIHAIAQKLQKPMSSFNQNYQIKIILTNNNCTPTILNSGLNITGDNVIDANIYGPIFNRICTTALATPIKANVIMEPLQ